MVETRARLMGGNLDIIEAKARNAVAEVLRDCGAQDAITVAVSGGADSLALAAVVSFLAKDARWDVDAVVIDHGLQTGSDDIARTTVEQLHKLGIPAHIKEVSVANAGGMEAAARKARYDYFDSLNAKAVLLAHTQDDQAETVLLGLGRGSGPRSIAGMRVVNGKYRRPFLTIRRSETEHICALHELQVWNDPHNVDPRFRRVRIRKEAIPLLNEILDGGVVESLSRTAEQIQTDLDYLDALVEGMEISHDCATLAALEPALRTRLLRRLAREAGAVELTALHIFELEKLITQWHGQGPIQLPGHISVSRIKGELRFEYSDMAG